MRKFEKVNMKKIHNKRMGSNLQNLKTPWLDKKLFFPYSNIYNFDAKCQVNNIPLHFKDMFHNLKKSL